jgi:hypothetical protein
MSINTRSPIVTNGLVLALDAKNPMSYPGSGTTWKDLSGNNNTCTLINGPTFSNDGGGSIAFDGVDDTSTANSSTSFQFGTNDFTVSYWAFINAFTGTGTPTFVDLRTTGDNGYSDYIQSNKFKLYWGPSDRYTSISNINTNIWYNITVTRKISTLSVYINSVLDGTTSDSTNLSGNAFRLARNATPGTSYLNGKIANVLLYKGNALSQTEITQNYNALKTRFGL